MKFQDYLVTTVVGNRSRKQVWDGRTPLPLDHPAQYVLTNSVQNGISLKKVIQEKTDKDKTEKKVLSYPIPALVIDRGSKMKVKYPAPGQQDRVLSVQIQRLKNIRASYLPLARSKAVREDSRPGQLFLFWGTRHYMIDFKPLGRKFFGTVARKRVFTLVERKGSYELTAHFTGVRFKYPGEARVEVPVEKAIVLSTEKITHGGLQWGKHWWRVNRVATPEKLPLDQMEADEARDRALFQRLMFGVFGAFLLFAGVLSLLPDSVFEPKKAPEPTTISLKAPKVIPILEPKPKEKAKPEKKVVELKPKKQEAKPVQKKKPAPPPKVAAAPKPPPVAKPKPLAPPPPTPVQPPVAVKPDPAAEAAKARAQLAKSLNFLSPSAKAPVANISNEKVNSKYNTVGNVDDPKKANSSVLSNITQSKKIDGPIETTNARNIKSDVVITQKNLNDVQGRVAIGDLHNSDVTGEFGSSLGGTGMSVSGPGQLADAEIEKTLKKYLQRFQYCYEKELLSDNTLSGIIQMQWTIQESGSVAEIQVLRSQLKRESLHQCLSKELGKIKFPAPKGGDVSIKYPFKFSSSSL